MTELSINWEDLNLNASVFFEGDGELFIGCKDTQSNHDDMDVDIDEDGCGCSENQLSHYDYDGSVLENLPEKCRQTVDGPIGMGAPCTTQAVNWLAELTAVPKYDDPNITESESVINSSMQVEAYSTSNEPPLPNQQANVKLPREQHLIQRVDDWTKKVNKATNSRKASKKRKIHVKILGDSRQLNVKISEK